jgi:hypothetical protein
MSAGPFGAGLGDRSSNDGLDLGGGQPLRHVAGQHAGLELLGVGQVLALRGLVLGNRVLALLEHLLDHRDHHGVGDLDLVVNALLLDRGAQQAQASLRALSPAFMAAFQSSSMRVSRLMA